MPNVDQIAQEADIIVNGFAFKKNENEILYIVRIPIYKGDLFKKDLSDMLTNHKTFEEMKNDTSVFIMSRSRYVRMQRELFEILDDINIIFDEEE